MGVSELQRFLKSDAQRSGGEIFTQCAEVRNKKQLATIKEMFLVNKCRIKTIECVLIQSLKDIQQTLMQPI